MHTPDTPERAALRLALKEVSRALIPQHRRLIDATRDDYAVAYAPVESPSQLLQLVNFDPFFAWLKPLTTLVVDIDEMARADFQPSDAARVAARLEQLFGTSADAAFAERYLPLVQRDVDVTVGQAALRKAITALRRG